MSARKRLRWLGHVLATGGLSLIFERAPIEPVTWNRETRRRQEQAKRVGGSR